MSNVLIVTGISEVKTDKNDREYKTIQVTKVEHKEIVNPLNGQKTIAIGNKRTSAFNAYKENYLGNMDLGWESKKGEVLLGDLVTRKTTDYIIETADGIKTVNSATVVVIGDSEDTVTFEKNVVRAFNSAAYAGKNEAPRFELISAEEASMNLSDVVGEMIA